MIAGIVEQSHHLRTDDWIDGIKGAEQDDVVGLYIGEDEVELVVGMVFIEKVLSIVLVVQESQ